jgi:two-component system cell cycle sensor histidine kinase/response regulator CckA
MRVRFARRPVESFSPESPEHAETASGLKPVPDRPNVGLPANALLSQRLSRLTPPTSTPEPILPPLPTDLDELQAQLHEARHSLLQWAQAETAWKGQRRLFKAVTEHVSDALAVADAQGRRIWTNHAFARLLRQSSDAAAGTNLFGEVHPDDAAPSAAALDEARRTGGVRELELRARRGDGSWAALAAKIIPISDNGRMESIVLVARDLTEKKQMAEALGQATREASTSGVTETMVRDLDQVLTSAFGNLTIAKNLNGAQNAVAVRLNEIDRALQRARSMLEQLGTLSGLSDRPPARVALEPLVQEVVNGVLRGTLVRAEYIFPRRLPQPEIDPEALSLALRNILTNSVQAMDRGVVRISAEALSQETVARQAPLALKPGSYVHLTIRDQGHGMSERTLAHAFDPSFTTRPGAKGLGLATALSAIKRLGGTILAQSTPAVGTTVHLYLPAPMDPALASAAAAPGAGPATAQKVQRILLMDDEQMILDIVSRMLSHLGYEVAVSRDGAQAIAAFTKAKAEGHPFDVVMMDLVIPDGLGGQEAAPTIRKIDPDARIIASSGHLDHPVMMDHRQYGFTAVLEKPYKLERLQQVIESVIKQGS